MMVRRLLPTQTTMAKHNIAERLWKIRSPGLMYRGEQQSLKQDTHGDEAVVDFPAEENRAYGKREDIEVDKRDRNNDMICICYGGDRPQDQNDWQPTPPLEATSLRSRRASGTAPS